MRPVWGLSGFLWLTLGTMLPWLGLGNDTSENRKWATVYWFHVRPSTHPQPHFSWHCLAWQSTASLVILTNFCTPVKLDVKDYLVWLDKMWKAFMQGRHLRRWGWREGLAGTKQKKKHILLLLSPVMMSKHVNRILQEWRSIEPQGIFPGVICTSLTSIIIMIIFHLFN